MIKIFNQVIMSKDLFQQEKRTAQKEGFRTALSKYKECDIVIKGEDVLLKGKTVKKVVILGDHAFIMNNFIKSKDGGIEIH